MKKRTTLKAAPLAAASFLSLAVVAPVSASAMPTGHYSSPMPHGTTWQWPMHDSMGMGMPMGGDMWSLPHDMPMSWDQAWYPGVVDDYAASITLVHIQVNARAEENKDTGHYDDKKKDDTYKPTHEKTVAIDHKEDSSKEHHKSDQHWEHNGVMYHHADEHKDYDHKEEDCLKDDSHDKGKYKVVWHNDGYWDYERKDWMSHHDDWKKEDWKHDDQKHEDWSNNDWKHNDHQYQQASYKNESKDHWNEDDCNREEQGHKSWEHESAKHDKDSSYEHVAEWDKKEDHKDEKKDWDSNKDKHQDYEANDDKKHEWRDEYKEESKDSEHKKDDYSKHDSKDYMKENENKDTKQYTQHVTYR